MFPICEGNDCNCSVDHPRMIIGQNMVADIAANQQNYQAMTPIMVGTNPGFDWLKYGGIHCNLSTEV